MYRTLDVRFSVYSLVHVCVCTFRSAKAYIRGRRATARAAYNHPFEATVMSNHRLNHPYEPIRLTCWMIGLLVLVLAVAPAHGQADTSDLDVDAYFDAAFGEAYEETMVARINGQIHRYFDRYKERVVERRSQYWDRDLSSREAYAQSVEPNRQHLREIIGVVDEREDPAIEYFSFENTRPLIAETDRYDVYQVRWPVLEGIDGVGLLLRPKEAVQARVVAYPDADQTPAQIAGLAPGVEESPQYARRLAESGVEVIVPLLIDRENTFSGGKVIPRLNWLDDNEQRIELWTNQAHREWIYKQAYVNGRHIIGYEVQKGLAAIDWFETQDDGDTPVGVVGYGEGGLLAFYAAAVDRRIDAAMVSGYFGPREDLSTEPVYRHVWGLLQQFGDAEIASLIMPRALVVEYSEEPAVEAPPPLEPYLENESWFHRIAREAGSPGRLTTPTFDVVHDEFERLRGYFDGSGLQPAARLIHGPERSTIGPGSDDALEAFAAGLSIDALGAPGRPGRWKHPDAEARMEAQMTQISRHLMRRVVNSDFTRYKFLDGDLSSPAAWDQSMEKYRDYLYEEIIGKLQDRRPAPNVRLRKVFEREDWVGHEVIMDVLPGVHGWGLLAVPADLEEGEKRPVVVVQHGQLGSPSTPVQSDSYNNILSRLCERGFVVFAPFNTYEFKVRKANPLKASVYSVLIPQYRQMVDWLKSLDYVDDDRMAFYGKSWGGRTALYIPPFIDDFKAVISSAYFNQWPRKLMTPHYASSYLFHGSAGTLGVWQFDQGNTFGHAELAMLVAPRPFMVENGYFDTVKPDEWASYEFAKVKRVYQMLGIQDRAVFGTHIGGHEVHADTIFPFLHEHLNWPVRAVK